MITTESPERSQSAISLITYRVPDRINVFLKIADDYQPFEKLSIGQRCTAILLTLMVEGNSPLIIDQPEDDLDNTIVCEGLVKNLWNLKGKRQIIFATHNANIPVLGDADLQNYEVFTFIC